mmetsp:Transcript_2324/g.3025  ORF Transcript_2324/g.3025 Transcript_2324/m.3025 type:complete len:81 (+) Transcript_2324:248-490(+)
MLMTILTIDTISRQWYLQPHDAKSELCSDKRWRTSSNDFRYGTRYVYILMPSASSIGTAEMGIENEVFVPFSLFRDDFDV